MRARARQRIGQGDAGGESNVLTLPRDLADKVDPDRRRGPIPDSVTMRSNAPPFSGELREEQLTLFSTPIVVPAGPGGAFIKRNVVTLRRPWPLVQAGTDFGDAKGNANLAFTILLVVITQRGRFAISPTTTFGPPVPGVGLAVPSVFVGSRVEVDLIISNAAASVTVNGLQIVIWGSDSTMQVQRIGDT